MADKKIEMRDKHNYWLIAGIVALFLVLVGVVVYGLFMPDDRPVISYNNQTPLSFGFMKVVNDKEYKIDYGTQIVEIELTVQSLSNDEKDDLNIAVTTEDTEFELPYVVIKGNRQVMDMEGYQQNLLLQIRVPEKFYYLIITLEQQDTKKETIEIDYRNFKQSKILEKGEKYLVEYENLQEQEMKLTVEIQANKNAIADLDNRLKGKIDDKTKQNLNNEKKQKEEAIVKQEKELLQIQENLKDYLQGQENETQEQEAPASEE